MNYDEFYGEQGGFRAASREWLVENTDLAEGSGRLLDAGCGDGEWSYLLAEWYEVTGVDLSRRGIGEARRRQRKLGVTEDRVEFRQGSALELGDEGWDVVFCRAPSFLNFPSESPIFQRNLKALLRHCQGGRLVYIKYTKEPYERWVESRFFQGFDTDPVLAPDSRWYYNDPDKARRDVAETVGMGWRVEVRIVPGYFVLKIGRD